MKITFKFFMYFLGWGLWYSLMFCLIVGTALYPLLGAVFVFYSPFIAIGWFACALIVMAYQALFFSWDTDLALYRRRIARIIGLLPAVLIILFFVFERMAAYESLDHFLLVILIGLPFIFWICCAMAYTARQYPLWIVQQINTHPDPLDLPRASPSIASERNRLLAHIHSRWIFALTGLPAALVYLYHITSAAYLFPCPESTALLYASFGFLVLLFTAYCAEGNAALITFIKVLILEDYFPNISLHRHRVILTMLSFFYTLVTTWWTLILAPLYAVFIAYHVYHTLALPDDGIDKAKRKEKPST